MPSRGCIYPLSRRNAAWSSMHKDEKWTEEWANKPVDRKVEQCADFEGLAKLVDSIKGALSVGPAGPKGDKGEKGDTGDRGAAGPAGLDGVNGKDGINGTNGTDGAVGPTGLQGEVGPAGPQGIQGEAGPVGPAGAPADEARMVALEAAKDENDVEHADFESRITAIEADVPENADAKIVELERRQVELEARLDELAGSNT